MRKLFLLFILTVILLGCTTRKVTSEFTKSDSTSIQKFFSKEVVTTTEIDSTVNAILPTEQSTSEKQINGNNEKGLFCSDTSTLETTAATSMAWVYNGQLFHILKNKKFIPVSVPFKSKSVEKHDSLSESTSDKDVNQTTKIEYIEKPLSTILKTLIASGIALWLLLAYKAFLLIKKFKPWVK